MKWRENHPEEMSKAGLKAWNKSPEERKERVKPLVIWVGQHKGKDSNILKWKIQNPEVASQISSQNMAELRRRMAKKRGSTTLVVRWAKIPLGSIGCSGHRICERTSFSFQAFGQDTMGWRDRNNLPLLYGCRVA